MSCSLKSRNLQTKGGQMTGTHADCDSRFLYSDHSLTSAAARVPYHNGSGSPLIMHGDARSSCLPAILRLTVIGVVLLASILSTNALDNGLVRTPIMGWNSWDHFLCNIDEELIRQTASLIQSTGLASHGYNYVNLDDCWAATRDSAGRVHADPKRFPNGMFQLAEYVHSLGLKIGIYSDAGNFTCAGRPGSLNFEVIDALTYAAWGIDFLKLDNCYSGTIPPQVRYPIMRDALNATGRPMVYSLCEWGVDNPATWAAKIGNLWRTTGDITDKWDSFLSNLDQNDQWWQYAAAGGFNDPDMLNVGNGGKSYTEYVSEFSLWALIKAPLLLSLDLRVVTNESLSILTNDEVIAINQDSLAVQGHRITGQATGLEVWAGPLANDDVAVVLFNRNTTTASITVEWTDIGLPASTKAVVRDLWKHADVGVFAGSFTGTGIVSHGSMTLRIKPQ